MWEESGTLTKKVVEALGCVYVEIGLGETGLGNLGSSSPHGFGGKSAVQNDVVLFVF